MQNAYNEPMEQYLIGSIISKPSRFDLLPDDLEETDFSPRNRSLFRIVKRMVLGGEDVDVISIAMEAEKEGLDCLDYVTDLAMASGSNVKAYAQAVIDHAISRQIALIANDLQNISQDKTSGSEKVEAAQVRIRSLDRAGNTEVLDLNKVLKQCIDDLDERFKNDGKIAGLSSGYEELDNYTNGFQGGELILIAGRPSMGKTTIAMNIGENIAMNDGSVLVFSAEMQAVGLGNRMLSSVSGVELSKIKSGKLLEDDWPKLEAGARRLKGKKIHIIEKGGISIEQIAAYSRRLNRKEKLDLIIVDYLQLITAKAENRTQIVGNVSMGLKAIAKETNTPVIALAQVNRDCEARSNKRPLASDLRESGQVEADADLVMFIYRDEVYNEDTQHKGVAELIIRKQRDGELGTVFLASHLQTNRFEPFDSANFTAQQKTTSPPKIVDPYDEEPFD